MVSQRSRQSEPPRIESTAAVFAVDLDQRIVTSTSAASVILGGRGVNGRICYEVMRSLDERNGVQCRPDCTEVTAARAGRIPHGSSLWDAACQKPRPITTVVDAREGLPPLIIHVLREAENPAAPHLASPPPEGLTRRQVEALRLLARGMSPRDIARVLDVSPVTVRNHVQTAMERLGAHTRLEAVMLASRAGLL